MDDAIFLSRMLAILSPLWIPIAFAAYAIGRRRFGLRLLILLLTVEAISIVAALAIDASALSGSGQPISN